MAGRRRYARRRSAGAKPRRAKSATAAKTDQLRHTTSVLTEEIAVQNAELMRAHHLLEESRERLAELYDFAPTAYLSLDRNGIISQINLTGCLMLGRQRDRIEGLPMVGLVAPEDRRAYLEFLRRCRAGAGAGAGAGRPDISVELSVKTGDGLRPVELLCRSRVDGFRTPGSELLTAMIDISDRRELESERIRAARDHAALASRLLSAQDEERQRIARDLHDNVGQQVTALRLMLQAAQIGALKGEVRTRIVRAQSIVEQIDRQLEFLTDELRPASLDLGIASGAEQFVKEWSSTFGIEAISDCHGMDAVSIDREVETHVYRVLQEALNNVAKHSHATCVSVKMEATAGWCNVVITDNGQGFDPAGTARHHGRGLGLLSMRERAHLVGGTFDLQSTPGQGTTIRLSVPIAGRTESR